MKNIYYKVIFKIEEKMYNEGFIIVTINDDNRLEKVEGVLTLDYLEGVIDEEENEMIFYYYVFRRGILVKELFFSLDLEVVEFPLSARFIAEELQMILITKYKITERVQKEKCDKILKRTKQYERT